MEAVNSTAAPLQAHAAAPERQAIIDLSAISRNITALREIAAPAKLMAVVKADAYGHGLVPVARAAVAAGAQWLGTAHVSEALALRAAGQQVPLLAWLHTPSTDFFAAVAQGIDLGCSGWELKHIAQAARAQERPARIHLKIDTGLGRNGSSMADWDALVAEAIAYQDEGLLRVVGVFSHFAVADEPHRPETDEQLQFFREAVAIAEDAGADLEVRHIANTPATLSRPDSHFDMVRVGLGIYGLSPFADQTSAQLGLTPAMTLQTRVALCKDVPAGQGVSYGLGYVTQAPTTLGLIPLGYADGIPRIATGGPVHVNGRTYPVVGRIAMDQMVIDLGPEAHTDFGGAEIPGSALGAMAVVFGDACTGAPAVERWAAAAGTLNYEVVTRISPRVPRIYVGGPSSAGPDLGEASPVNPTEGPQ